MQTGVLVEPFRRKRAKKNGPFGAVETVDKVVNLRDGKVGQPLAAPPLYGCRIPLAGEGCARETQEGIHRRLKPISGYFISADWEPSSKQACLIRHRRRFACFPAPLKS